MKWIPHYRDLMLFEGDIVDLLPRIRSVQQNSSWPPGWSLTWVDRETKREDITKIQDLQKLSGLSPLPGPFIRGLQTPVSTAVLSNGAGEILGSAVIQDLSPTAARYHCAAMLLCNCLRSDVRGRGFAHLLTAARLTCAVDRYGTRKFYAEVATGNVPSLRVMRRWGLSPHPSEGFILVWIPE